MFLLLLSAKTILAHSSVRKELSDLVKIDVFCTNVGWFITYLLLILFYRFLPVALHTDVSSYTFKQVEQFLGCFVTSWFEQYSTDVLRPLQNFPTSQ